MPFVPAQVMPSKTVADWVCRRIIYLYADTTPDGRPVVYSFKHVRPTRTAAGRKAAWMRRVLSERGVSQVKVVVLEVFHAP